MAELDLLNIRKYLSCLFVLNQTNNTSGYFAMENVMGFLKLLLSTSAASADWALCSNQ